MHTNVHRESNQRVTLVWTCVYQTAEMQGGSKEWVRKKVWLFAHPLGVNGKRGVAFSLLLLLSISESNDRTAFLTIVDAFLTGWLQLLPLPLAMKIAELQLAIVKA